jgi:predicted ATPase
VLGCLASPGTCISLRVPAQRTFSLQECVASGSLSSGAAQLLTRMIEAKLAFLISGGTGSGKTTLRLRHYWAGRIAADPDGSSMLRTDSAVTPFVSRWARSMLRA